MKTLNEYLALPYLVSMAYNILKLHHKIQTGRLGNHLFAQDTA